MTDKPLRVTQEDIDAFEKTYPLYRGIGRKMIEHGFWILVDQREKGVIEQ